MVEKARRENHNIPSFSSSVLEAIYRSIDDVVDYSPQVTSDQKMRTKQRSATSEEVDRRRFVIEKLKQRKIAEKVDAQRTQLSVHSDKTTRRVRKTSGFPSIHSSSCSSESSCGGGFSSSEAESIFHAKKAVPVIFPAARKEVKPGKLRSDCFQRKSRQISHFEETDVKAKSKALEMYSNLKNAKKQPMSPGARMAGFLNSLLTTAGNTLKTKTTLRSAQSSACSTPSSFSRSCLSKTPSSMGKQSNSLAAVEKRTVRFVDEVERSQRGNSDCVRNEPKRHVEEVARDQKQHLMKIKQMVDLVLKEEEEESDDEGLSCCSSDLFELDSLSAIGVGDRYQEELPVYGTTKLCTNRATVNTF